LASVRFGSSAGKVERLEESRGRNDDQVVPRVREADAGGVAVGGIMFERAVSEIQLDEWDLMMAVNLRAPLFLAQAALPHLVRGAGVPSSTSGGSLPGSARRTWNRTPTRSRPVRR
jgi:NAD(P)-dependent dehydrogenase (short-subunit alcohol dehydrogenase family)